MDVGNRAEIGRKATEYLTELRRKLLPPGTQGGPDALVFPGRGGGGPLGETTLRKLLRRMGRGNATVHGLRSTFRDWAGEATAHPREVAEHALAHRVGDKAEQSYARGDLFVKRRRLMEEWAEFCAGAPAALAPMLECRAPHPAPAG